MADETLFRRGDRIAEKYVVEGELGRGGMAVVVAARHAELGHEVAIKALLPEALRHESGADRLLREARAAARLQSEHVTRVFDVGRLPSGAPFIVLERLQGMDLHALLEARGALPVAMATRAVREACDAVAEAHDSGIVHRDLKPSNLFLARRRDGSALVKVLDFGIAKASASLDEAALTTTSSSLGTPLYMAPEQIMDAKSVTAAVDVWALGVTLYELLTDAIPWDVQNVHALLAKIMTEPPLPLRRRRADLPAALETVVMRCLARAPGDRFPDARALSAALVPFASSTPLVLPTPEVDLDAPTETDASVGLVAPDTDVSAPPSAVLRDTTTNPMRDVLQATAEAPTRRQAGSQEGLEAAAATATGWDTRGASAVPPAAGRPRGRVLGAAVALAALLGVGGLVLALRGDDPVPVAPAAPAPTPERGSPEVREPEVAPAPADPEPVAPATASAEPSAAAAASSASSPRSAPGARPPATSSVERPPKRPPAGASGAASAPRPPAVPSAPARPPASWGPLK